MTIIADDDDTPIKTQSSSVWRALKSCEPDLEIVVGPEKVVFHYHSSMMASYSDYIDTMLATPMRESSTMKISFPDIQPSVWKKMMTFLEPGGTREVDIEDYGEILPYYDEYNFQIGLDLCDRTFSEYFDLRAGGSLISWRILVDMATLSNQFDLSGSKEKAIEFAKDMFDPRRTTTELEASEYRSLIPLIQDEEETLKNVVSLIHGEEETSDMTLEEMKEITKEESFTSSFRTKCLQIEEVTDVLRRLPVTRVEIGSSGVDVINGEYRKAYSTGFEPAVMSILYSRDVVWNDEPAKATLKALDPFGKKWQISISPDDEDRESQVYYTWKADYGALVPPKHGWVAVAEEYSPVPRLYFHFDRC